MDPVLQNANGDVSTELNNMESLMNMGCDAVVIMDATPKAPQQRLKNWEPQECP